jgi:tRNA(fMet)-specific endonuclease VapC
VEVSRLLLDTSAYAAFFRDHPGVKEELREASEIHLSPIVLGELRSGFLKAVRREENEEELQQFLASPRCAVPVIDDETSHRYAAIHDYLRRKGTPVSPNDLWIAASAAQHGLMVVTLNGDFDMIPHVLVRKFEPPPPRSR